MNGGEEMEFVPTKDGGQELLGSTKNLEIKLMSPKAILKRFGDMKNQSPVKRDPKY